MLACLHCRFHWFEETHSTEEIMELASDDTSLLKPTCVFASKEGRKFLIVALAECAWIYIWIKNWIPLFIGHIPMIILFYDGRTAIFSFSDMYFTLSNETSKMQPTESDYKSPPHSFTRTWVTTCPYWVKSTTGSTCKSRRTPKLGTSLE